MSTHRIGLRMTSMIRAGAFISIPSASSPGERRIQVGAQFRGAAAECSSAGPDDDAAALGNGIEAIAHEVSELPFDPVASRRPFDLPLRHDETDEAVIALLVGSCVDDQDLIPGSRSLPERPSEILGIDHPVCARQHQRSLRRTAWRGPCGGGRPEWRGRRGCSCEDGSRASSSDDGCSAGRSAWWSLQFSSAGAGRQLPLIVHVVATPPRLLRAGVDGAPAETGTDEESG